MLRNIDRFSAPQKQHVEVMILIAKCFKDTPMVLKGGTALLLAYGLDRYSEDLDFDTTRQIKPDSRIREAVRKTKIKITEIKSRKDTPTVQRWMIYYSGPQGDGTLKLEVSSREETIDGDSYQTINDIQAYKVSALIGQKLDAMNGRSKIRDLYDVCYLAREYSADFLKEHCARLKVLTDDPDGLMSRYRADHQEDPILHDEDLDDLVLELAQSVEEIEEVLKLQ